MRAGNEFKMFERRGAEQIDPKDPASCKFKEVKTDEFVLVPPNSFILAKSLEYFRIPRNILTICMGKSTYARCGIIVNVTPFEPEWEGYVTMSISNTSSVPVKLYANEGIAQVMFFQSDEDCAVSYKDKKGKYQAQKEITLPKI
jgi:dCTP deaminase